MVPTQKELAEPDRHHPKPVEEGQGPVQVYQEN